MSIVSIRTKICRLAYSDDVPDSFRFRLLGFLARKEINFLRFEDFADFPNLKRFLMRFKNLVRTYVFYGGVMSGKAVCELLLARFPTWFLALREAVVPTHIVHEDPMALIAELIVVDAARIDILQTSYETERMFLNRPIRNVDVNRRFTVQDNENIIDEYLQSLRIDDFDFEGLAHDVNELCSNQSIDEVGDSEPVSLVHDVNEPSSDQPAQEVNDAGKEGPSTIKVYQRRNKKLKVDGGMSDSCNIKNQIILV